MKYTNVFYCSVCFSDQLFLAPDKMITTCKINGSEYEDLSLVPTSNISDPCEVCHCRVSVCKIMQLYSVAMSSKINVKCVEKFNYEIELIRIKIIKKYLNLCEDD